MDDPDIHLEGQAWELARLARSCSSKALPGVLARSRLLEELGPSALLGAASVSTTPNVSEAKSLLRTEFGFDQDRASDAVAVGKLATGTGDWGNDPIGFLAGVRLSAAHRARVFRGLTPSTTSTPAPGQKLCIGAARQAWDGNRFRQYVAIATKSGDTAVMSVAASIAAGLRRHDPEGFVHQLTESMTQTLISVDNPGQRRSLLRGRQINTVLSAAYALSTLDTPGLDLGSEFWADAPPRWRSFAAPWVASVLDRDNGSTIGNLLGAIHSRGLKFVETGRPAVPFLDSQRLLDDTQLRLQACASQLTKWFESPVWFDGGPGQVQILLAQDDRYMYAWVGVDGAGCLVAYDLVHRFPLGQDVPGTRAALALALGWYLDVSISLRRSPGGTPTLRLDPVDAAPTEPLRYVPTHSFQHQIQEVVSGRNSPPRPHGVVAHLRTLPEGQTPSPRTLQNAPKRLRASMGPSQTFIREHLKGTGSAAMVETRLSKYSSLADVMAALPGRGAAIAGGR